MRLFWRKENIKMTEDLKEIEGRLRAHGIKTPEPSEEFRGRLETRLDHAWNHRQWHAERPRYFTFVPQIAIACAVLVLAFITADVTTRFTRMTFESAPKTVIPEPTRRPYADEEKVQEKSFSAVATQSEISAPPAAAKPDLYRATLFGSGSLQTTTSLTTAEEERDVTILLWFVAYVVIFGSIATLLYVLFRQRT